MIWAGFLGFSSSFWRSRDMHTHKISLSPAYSSPQTFVRRCSAVRVSPILWANCSSRRYSVAERNTGSSFRETSAFAKSIFRLSCSKVRCWSEGGAIFARLNTALTRARSSFARERRERRRRARGRLGRHRRPRTGGGERRLHGPPRNGRPGEGAEDGARPIEGSPAYSPTIAALREKEII